MRYWMFGLLITLISLSKISAQAIKLSLPENASQEYYIVLCKGLELDTVASGYLNMLGQSSIEIPQKYKGYKGVGFLRIKGDPMRLLIINGENFEMKSVNGKFEFENSKENTAFYKKDPELLADTALYAKRFLEMTSYLQALNSVVSGKDISLNKRYQVRQYAVSNLSVDDLYTSGLWFFIIDGLTKLNYDQESFAKDMYAILSRAQSDAIFVKFSEDLITIMNQYGWDDAFDIIVPSIMKSGRIEAPQGALYDAFQMAKLSKGTVAPRIEGLLETGHGGMTLVLFFESDCPNCKLEVEKLKGAYMMLREKGIRVISISADYDRASYEKIAENMPWADKLCDFKGFAGANFINFGILATPTYFFLDSEYKVVGRYSSFGNIKF